MSTKTHTVNRDARVADAVDLGSGACDHLNVGTYGGYQYLTWLAFTGESWSGIPSAASISSAVLKIYAGSQYHVARTAGTMRARRTSSIGTIFTEGTSTHPMEASNSVTGTTDPAVTSTDSATVSVADADGWKSITITNIIKAYYGQSNYAICLDDNGSALVVEFDSREAGTNDAYITITYDANSAPTAPTLNAPANSSLVGSTTPTYDFTHNDPDGDACASWDLQVDQTTADGVTPDWVSPIVDLVNQTSDLTNPIQVTPGTALTRGNWYAYRARTADAANGDGAWSSPKFFKVGALPTTALTVPLTGQTARVYYNPGTNTTPKFRVSWSFADTDGHAQASAIIRVYAASGSPGSQGALQHTHNHSGSETTADLSAYSPTNGTYYFITVQVTCETGGQSAETTSIPTRVRWGRASYYYSIGSTPVSWGTPILTSTVPANTELDVEYAGSTNTTEPTTWYATTAEVPLGTNTYLWHRATMVGWGSATPSKPALQSIALYWSATSLTPDHWVLGTGASIDTGTQYYGSQCLKVVQDNVGSTRSAYQTVFCQPNTTYMLQARIKVQNNPRARIQIWSADGVTLLAQTGQLTVTTDWVNAQNVPYVYSVAWNSGGNTSVRVVCTTETGATGTAWFDAIMLAASTIVQPWSPGFVGDPVVIDSGGLQVDAVAGGVFRLRGQTGGTRDTVELGLKGLEFGLDTEVYSDEDNHISVKGSGAAQKGSVLPTGALVMWGTTTAPAGFLLCDGTSYLRADYATLFGVIGTTFGSVDGTHFNVPDMRQRFPLGLAASGTGSTLGGTGGSIDHVHTVATHNHGGNTGVYTAVSDVSGAGNVRASTHSHTIATHAANDTTTENPPFLALTYVIKT
jgi:microcystin-dependent protein